MKKKINKNTGILFSIFFIVIMLSCVVISTITKRSLVTLICCLSSIAYIVFLSERSILNFVIGFVSSATYIYIAFTSKLYGEVIFYLFFDIPMIFVSYFLWKKKIEKKHKVKVRKMSFKFISILFVVSITAVLAYAKILSLIGGEYCILDATSTVVTLIATVLMALRYREQWIMWVVVYVVSTLLWITVGDILMIIMSASCLFYCINGFIVWSKYAKKVRNSKKIKQA